MANGRTWRFVRTGGFDQVKLDRGADLAAIGELDQKLWVALACPVFGLFFDTRTLQLIDSDKDGRIRAPELIGAVKWATSVLKSPDALVAAAADLPLAAINDASDEGKALLASARQVLKVLGKADATTIGVGDTGDTMKIFAATPFNGDGVVPADAAAAADVKAVMEEIIRCLGPETDRSGKVGVNQAKLDQFYTDLTAWLAWRGEPEADPAICPLGDGTAAAATATQAVKAKIDDYFARCRVVSFDPRAAAAMNRAEGEFATLGGQVLSADATEMEGFPLAGVAADAALPLGARVNPAWAGRVAAFVSAAVTPLLGARESLTPADWQALQAKLAPYFAWQGRRAGASVEPLGRERLQAIAAGSARAAIADLIAQDKALEKEADAIAAVDKLVRYHRDLYRLSCNFVAFHDFYNPNTLAIFQAGTLYLDQRACVLCLRIEDAAKHSAMAGLSCAYVAYADCVRKGSNEKFTIAAAFTGGDSDYLAVGRNGIFYDRDGKDWDATITKIIENPISVRQAILAPYKKFAKLVEDQVAKFAGAREKAVETAASSRVDSAGKIVDPAKAGEKPGAFDVAKFAGIFAAIGLAIGAIGGAIGAMLSAFSRLAWWQMPLAVLGILILISGPSVLIAALKLRRRNIGPLLDAAGWAINARARINIPFGGSLTQVAAIPSGSERDMRDPYLERHAWRKVVTVLLVLVVLLGIIWQLALFSSYWRNYLPLPKWKIEKEQRELEFKLNQVKLENENQKANLPAPAPAPAPTPAPAAAPAASTPADQG